MAPFSKRNKFIYKPEHLFTGKMGELIPFINFPVVPGDTFNVVTDNMTRFQAMLSPAYAKVNTYTHFFFVPYRLIWDDWEDFITKGEDGRQTPAYPQVSLSAQNVGSLADYLGLPTGVAMTVSALPFRACALIYNEWYRNENLQTELPLSTASGADSTTNTSLFYRNWRPDYFTQNLPFQQRGPQVTVPLGSSAPIYGGDNNNYSLPSTYNIQPLRFVSRGGSYPIEVDDTGYALNLSSVQHSSTTSIADPAPAGTVFIAPGVGNKPNALSSAGVDLPMYPANLYADLSQASSASIADWRLAFQIQRLLEKNARGGARYVEWLMSHFGVRCSDARLQRPEYLGGGKSPVMISEVLQTSSTDNTSPQGNMSGHAFSVQRSHSFTKSFNEYGIVIGFYSCMPRSLYYQGIPREWLKTTPYEHYLPVLSHLSEQGTYKGEVYADGTTRDKEIFGFNPIYEEYRHMYSTVSGQFRSTLDYWHFGRRWDANNKPELNSAFEECKPSEAPFAVSGQDNLLVTCTTTIKALRPIPKHGTPGYIDHD